MRLVGPVFAVLSYISFSLAEQDLPCTPETSLTERASIGNGKSKDTSAGSGIQPPSFVTSSIGSISTLTLVNKQIAPDGFSRPSVLAGGTFPGPLITGNKGDKFTINVQNQLTDTSMLRASSIHWHGFFQNHSPFEDGVAFVTQCPITPGTSFVYDFKVNSQAGTFWYHSHLSSQYCDGLRGPLVVYDPQDPNKHLYDIDNAATVITLADWYHFVAPQAPFVPDPASTLINGLGRYAGGPVSQLAVISVTKGQRYRFRIVSMACDPNFIFAIDGHTMTIIEADGVNTNPLTVDSLQIFAAQRYSVVVNANQAVGNYWVRANPNIGTTGFDGGINSAILRYVGATVAEPTTVSVSTNPMVETNLHSYGYSTVPGKPYPGGADININLKVDLDFNTLKFTVNGAPFDSPSVPVILQILSGARTAQELLPPGSVYALPPNRVIEISVPGGTIGAPHPFHLHGHTFYVVRSAGSSTYNYRNPLVRDVVNTGLAGDNVTFRFVTDNAGPWFLHCHIDWHLDKGLAIVFAENAPAIKTGPSTWQNLCPTYDAFALAGGA
ncbi:laccase 2 precursor [Roridomyces roridus]|uniref:Laccase 2 n=1 Tax=Roridomyces roridus TaxID=1738132 RepID=A0AAD7BZR9_9AGAR|nr:laccase 2 precursor [Roridomyces roridus]